MPAQHPPNAAMKRIAAAALAILLLASPGHSQTKTGNCFHITTEEEQKAGEPSIAPADYCSKEDGEICFRQKGIDTVHPDYTQDTKFVPVERCNKYDQFDEGKTMPTQHQPNAAMKVPFATFAVLLTASSGHSQTMRTQHQPNASMKKTRPTSELKPCPFCASPAVIDNQFVGCPECEIGFSCKDNNLDDVGVLAWNCRPCSEVSDEEF